MPRFSVLQQRSRSSEFLITIVTVCLVWSHFLTQILVLCKPIVGAKYFMVLAISFSYPITVPRTCNRKCCKPQLILRTLTSLRLERASCTMADADKRERNRRLYFKNLRKQQKRRRVDRKREQNEAQCNRNHDDLVKNCTAEKADKVEIDQIPEPPAKKPQQVEDENYKEAEAECSGIQALKALQLVGNCTATTVEQAEKIEKAQGKRPKATENERFFLEIDPKNMKPLGKTIGSGTFGVCQLAQYKNWTVAVKEC